MPAICRFRGIVIYMNAGDHSPPHFHVRYAEQDAAILIETLAIDQGELPPRVLRRVRQWAAQHTNELIENWDRTSNGEPPVPIPPL